MSVDIRLPNITGRTETEQLTQIKSYLYQFAEQLQWALKNVEGGGNSSNVLYQSTSATAAVTNTAASNFSELKALIIKSADIVKAYYEKIDSLIKELRADLLKQTVKPTFSLKRTLITIGILLSVCLPLTARFIDSPVVDDVCLKLWGIVLIAFCIYFVWWLDDFVLVVSRKSDGSVEFREERMSEIKKNPYWKYT